MRSMFATLALFFAATASAQPLLDRVLDRVQQELGDRPNPIPVDDVSPAGDPLLEPNAPNREQPGYLGVVADDRQDEGRGVRLLDVVAGGPAEQGGLEAKDLITLLNGTPIRTMDEMARILSAMPAGEQIEFGIERDGTPKTLLITLGMRPGPGDRRFEKFGKQPEELGQDGPILVPTNRPKLGVRTLPVTDQAMQQFNLPSRDGAIVVAVTPGSPADRAGLKQGAVITELNGEPVLNPDQLAAMVSGTRGDFELSFIQDGRPGRARIVFGNAPSSRVVERPVAPQPAGDSRLEAIERRLQQLEDRIEKLEQSRESET